MSRIVIERLCESSSMCVDAVISRSTRSSSVISSGATDAEQRKRLLGLYRELAALLGRIRRDENQMSRSTGRQNVPVCCASSDMAVVKSTSSTRRCTRCAGRSGSNAALIPNMCVT